jgi:hypothetical protein
MLGVCRNEILFAMLLGSTNNLLFALRGIIESTNKIEGDDYEF